ncbi:MAG: gamma-glutamyltransferase [Pseudomonadota bacterium]|nr:gamma-glutamyltransferase [Pseudomonadota bacterium]
MAVAPLILLVACATAPETAPTSPVSGAVAADHPLASRAGADVLRAGGNAVDAAIAAALSSGVVQPTGSGLGGGGFAVVVTPDGTATTFDFREVAPAAATRDMFLAQGASSTIGGLAVAVPAEGIGLAKLHERFGKAPMGSIAAPAIEQASKGFETGPHLAEALLQAPDMAALFAPGNVRAGLAEALRAWVTTRGEAFRTGWVAEDMVDAARAAGGVLTLADMAAYAVIEREPLRGTYGGRAVITMPPPSSGGVALLQMLGATAGVADPHCAVEAAKHAMADRAAYGGDPSFVPVDVSRLLSSERIGAIRADCGPATFPPEHYAPPVASVKDAGTLHISVIDGSGMAVALTTTINTSFGSKVVAPRSGIVLNNEMDDFAARPGTPNAFGLIQGEANAVEPGKRPLSSMTPTVVLGADGRPELAVGGSGGPTIITATYQVIRGVLDEGRSAQAAVDALRWHHQWQPNVLFIEPGHADMAGFEAHGHVLKEAKAFSAVQAVRRTAAGFEAASDPRKHGAPVVLP